MASEIYEKEFDKGVIEQERLLIYIVRKIQVIRLSLSKDGIQRIFMTKEYQNNEVNEYKEIGNALMQIYEKNHLFAKLL